LKKNVIDMVDIVITRIWLKSCWKISNS